MIGVAERERHTWPLFSFVQLKKSFSLLSRFYFFFKLQHYLVPSILGAQVNLWGTSHELQPNENWSNIYCSLEPWTGSHCKIMYASWQSEYQVHSLVDQIPQGISHLRLVCEEMCRCSAHWSRFWRLNSSGNAGMEVIQ